MRHLSHPEPLEMVLKAMDELTSRTQDHRYDLIHMIHRREPFPLYEILNKRGWSYKTIERGDRLFDIWIFPPDFVEIPQ